MIHRYVNLLIVAILFSCNNSRQYNGVQRKLVLGEFSMNLPIECLEYLAKDSSYCYLECKGGIKIHINQGYLLRSYFDSIQNRLNADSLTMDTIYDSIIRKKMVLFENSYRTINRDSVNIIVVLGDPMKKSFFSLDNKMYCFIISAVKVPIKVQDSVWTLINSLQKVKSRENQVNI